MPDDWDRGRIAGSLGIVGGKGIWHAACGAACAIVAGAHTTLLQVGNRKQWNSSVTASHAVVKPRLCQTVQHAVSLRDPLSWVRITGDHVPRRKDLVSEARRGACAALRRLACVCINAPTKEALARLLAPRVASLLRSAGLAAFLGKRAPPAIADKG